MTKDHKNNWALLFNNLKKFLQFLEIFYTEV